VLGQPDLEANPMAMLDRAQLVADLEPRLILVHGGVAPAPIGADGFEMGCQSSRSIAVQKIGESNAIAGRRGETSRHARGRRA